MNQRSRLSLVAMCGVLMAFDAPSVRTQTPAAPDIRALFSKTEHMVPMRDGLKLFTIVYGLVMTPVPYRPPPIMASS